MPDDVGLCLTCRWTRVSRNRRGSRFFRCARAESDPAFVRYPPLPVRSCPGYEEVMLFVVLLHYTKPLDEVNAVRPAHNAHLERQAAQGTVLAWARREPPAGGVLVVAAPDRAAVERVVAGDPYVREGVARAEIVEFREENVRRSLEQGARRGADG
jgi:uncharacterized protein YciI